MGIRDDDSVSTSVITSMQRTKANRYKGKTMTVRYHRPASHRSDSKESLQLLKHHAHSNFRSRTSITS